MKKPLFTGSGVAIVTPFTKETVDLPTLGKLLDFQMKNGTDAIIVCGTTGEASTMSYRERMRTIEFCVDHVDGRLPVIAGTGSNSTENALALSRDAERAGADGLLLVTPYYNKASQAGLIRHFQVIADGVDVPLILYDVPSRTGVTIAPETYAELAKHPNINGVKEAGGNFSNIQKTRNLCPEDFSIWSGNDDETAAICMLGGKGVISVVANVLPAEMHRLTELCLRNDFAAAGKLQLELKDFCDAMFCDVNPIPVKTALNLLGWDVGPLRLPLCDPTEAGLEKIRAALEKHGLTSSVSATAARLSPGGCCSVYFRVLPPYCSEDRRTWASPSPMPVISTVSLFRRSALSPSWTWKARTSVSPAGMRTMENSSWLIWPTVQGRKTRTRMSWSPWFSITRAA